MDKVAPGGHEFFQQGIAKHRHRNSVGDAANNGRVGFFVGGGLDQLCTRQGAWLKKSGTLDFALSPALSAGDERGLPKLLSGWFDSEWACSYHGSRRAASGLKGMD